MNTKSICWIFRLFIRQHCVILLYFTDIFPLFQSQDIQVTNEGPSCSLSMGMHTEILYANTGALANPQPKIIGVSFKYEPKQTITYTVNAL